jgi:hypothetical protein
VVTPEGWLFDKEAVLKYMLEKREEYTRKVKEYERQKSREEKEQKETEEAEKQAAVKSFEKSEKNILQKGLKAEAAGSSKAALPSFWCLCYITFSPLATDLGVDQVQVFTLSQFFQAFLNARLRSIANHKRAPCAP